MAIYENGPFGDFHGRHGNMVFYKLNGKTVGRQIGEIDPSTYTVNQFAVRQKTTLINPVLKATKAYTRMGFKNSPKPGNWDFYSMATSMNNPGAITGDYPHQEVNHSKVILSAGKITAPVSVGVRLINNALEFTWTADLENENSHPRDQIMLCAYFPETEKALTLLSGARRPEEQQLLPLPSFTHTMAIETYLSFVADDRSDVSNSVYGGRIIWDNSTEEDGNL